MKNRADYLRNTIDLVKQIETRFLELAKRLHKIKVEQLWEGEYDSLNQFLEEAHVNTTTAYQLIKIYEVYVIEGGRDTKELAGIGYSNLYRAIPLIQNDGIETTVVKAQTLSRSEIIDEVKEDQYGQDHVHKPKDDARYAFCECGKLFRTDA